MSLHERAWSRDRKQSGVTVAKCREKFNLYDKRGKITGEGCWCRIDQRDADLDHSLKTIWTGDTRERNLQMKADKMNTTAKETVLWWIVPPFNTSARTKAPWMDRQFCKAWLKREQLTLESRLWLVNGCKSTQFESFVTYVRPQTGTPNSPNARKDSLHTSLTLHGFACLADIHPLMSSQIWPELNWMFNSILVYINPTERFTVYTLLVMGRALFGFRTALIHHCMGSKGPRLEI